MTPHNSSSAWDVSNNGNVGDGRVIFPLGLRAVINVNSDVTITGGKWYLVKSIPNIKRQYKENKYKRSNTHLADEKGKVTGYPQ